MRMTIYHFLIVLSLYLYLSWSAQDIWPIAIYYSMLYAANRNCNCGDDNHNR